jgi:hypothetical protein
MLASEIAVFAGRYNIAASVAYVLPALFERTAQMAGLPVHSMVSRATYDSALGEYLAEAARKVAAEDKGAA